MNLASIAKGHFSFLERSIGVLIVDDEPAVAALHFEYLNSYKLYHVACAPSIKEAESMLLSSQRFHVCLLDLGLTDFDCDEYYLIKKYSPEVSFIVVSARNSLEKGFTAGACGALAVINKPVEFFKVDFIDRINDAFFRSLLVPEKLNRSKQIIRDAIETYISIKPVNVRQWAEKVGVEERYFRKVWAECFDYPPRYVTWLHRIYSRAFSFYKTLYCEEFRIKKEKNGLSVRDIKDIEYINRRFRFFYKTYETATERIINRKPLTA
jgi:response regulator of citrate/malate metabolism